MPTGFCKSSRNFLIIFWGPYVWVQDLPAGWSFELFICVAGMALFRTFPWVIYSNLSDVFWGLERNGKCSFGSMHGVMLWWTEVFNGGLLAFAEVCLIVGLSVCWIAIFNVLGRQKLLRQRSSWKQPRQGWRRHSQSRKVSFKKNTFLIDRILSIDTIWSFYKDFV